MTANVFTPKPVMVGPVYDTDGTTPVEGAYVRAYNWTNQEFSTEVNQTDVSGLVVMDMANFETDGYAKGDVISFYVDEGLIIEGQDIVDKVARDIIKQVKANIKSFSGTQNRLFYGGLLTNTRDPYDEVNKVFKRRVEMNFKAINVGEI